MSITSIFAASGFTFTSTQPAQPSRGNVWPVRFSDKSRFNTDVGSDYVLCLGESNYPGEGYAADALYAPFLSACNTLRTGGVYVTGKLTNGNTLNGGWTGVAALVNKAAVANTTVAKSVLGSRWVFDGDSITINGITTDATGNQNRLRSWTSEMVRLSNGRIQYVHNAAVAGRRIDQMLAAFDTAVATKTPDVVFLTAMTNDVGQGRSMALAFADLTAYLLKCQAISATLVVGEIWPTDETVVSATRGADVRTWNRALQVWATSNDVQLVRWSYFADPITGGWPTTWTADKIHPTLLDSYSQIGAFGWAAVSPKVGPAAASIPRAVINGEGLLANGFFTTLNAVVPVPTGTVATPSVLAGTLADGTYSYKLTGRTFFGEGLPSAAASAVLAGTGQNSVAFTTPAGARGVNIYRKAPGDADWLFLVYVANGGSPYLDTGAVTAGAAITGVDTSAAPTGLTHGTTLLRALSGAWVTTETGIRGNIVRLRGSGGSDQDYLAGNVTAGTEYVLTCLVRGSGVGAGEGSVYIRWRDAANGSGNAVGQTIAYQQRLGAGWGLVHIRATAPTGVLSGRISFETDSTVDYIDVAEVLFTTAS